MRAVTAERQPPNLVAGKVGTALCWVRGEALAAATRAYSGNLVSTMVASVSRSVCITCGEARGLSQRGIEDDSGSVKAETRDACHTYAKMFHQARGMQMDAFADDLATLGLDLLVADAGWARQAPNPWWLIGAAGAD